MHDTEDHDYQLAMNYLARGERIPLDIAARLIEKGYILEDVPENED